LPEGSGCHGWVRFSKHTLRQEKGQKQRKKKKVKKEIKAGKGRLSFARNMAKR
jgi:hypothetical protein